MAETIGSLMDKIIINDLKIYHNREQLGDAGISKEKKDIIGNKLAVLDEQKKDLQDELNELLKDVASGRRKLKIYRQFKQYGQTKT